LAQRWSHASGTRGSGTAAVSPGPAPAAGRYAALTCMTVFQSLPVPGAEGAVRLQRSERARPASAQPTETATTHSRANRLHPAANLKARPAETPARRQSSLLRLQGSPGRAISAMCRSAGGVPAGPALLLRRWLQPSASMRLVLQLPRGSAAAVNVQQRVRGITARRRRGPRRRTGRKAR